MWCSDKRSTIANKNYTRIWWTTTPNRNIHFNAIGVFFALSWAIVAGVSVCFVGHLLADEQTKTMNCSESSWVKRFPVDCSHIFPCSLPPSPLSPHLPLPPPLRIFLTQAFFHNHFASSPLKCVTTPWSLLYTCHIILDIIPSLHYPYPLLSLPFSVPFACYSSFCHSFPIFFFFFFRLSFHFVVSISQFSNTLSSVHEPHYY